MRFDEVAEFRKECKRLAKKYKSLLDDLQEFREVVSVIPHGNSKHFYVVRQTDDLRIIKARLFCRYLRGSSLRIIYAYSEKDQRIEFIELYYKAEKGNEERGRISKYLKIHKSTRY